MLQVADLKGMPPQLRLGVINFLLNGVDFRDNTHWVLRLVQKNDLTPFKQVLSIPAIVCAEVFLSRFLFCGHPPGIAFCEGQNSCGLVREPDFFASLFLRSCVLSNLLPLCMQKTDCSIIAVVRH